MKKFTLGGLDSYDDLGLILEDVKMPVLGTLTETMQEVPGMIGAIPQGTSIGAKPIDLDVVLTASSEEDRAIKLNYLASVLKSLKDIEMPLIVDDNIRWEYNVHLTNVTIPERLTQTSHDVRFTITVTASDPRGYGELITTEITNSPFTIVPDGQSDVYPVLTCIPDTDITQLAIVDDQENWAYIGSDVDFMQGDLPANNEPLILDDRCSTSATWDLVDNTKVTFKLDGKADGSIKIQNDSIQANSYGALSDKYHGPVFQQYLGQDCGDYRIRVRLCNIQHYNRARGIVEVYLLDVNGDRIGKIAISDKSDGSDPYALI